MKGLFRRNIGSENSAGGSGSSSARGTGLSGRLASALGPQYSLPPFPQPLPERLLSVRCTSNGLLVLPVTAPRTHPPPRRLEDPRTCDDASTEDVAHDKAFTSTHTSVPGSAAGAKIGWGRDGKVMAASAADVQGATTDNDDSLSVGCYGIIGIVRVFNGAYILVVTSRTLSGDFLQANRPVYRCSGVLVVPLTYEGAKATLTKEAKRQLDARMALAQVTGREQDSSEEEDQEQDDVITPSVIAKQSFEKKQADAVSSIHATVTAKKTSEWFSSRSKRVTASESDSTPSAPADKAHVPQGQVIAIDAPDPLLEVDPATRTPADRWHEATLAELEDKVVKETARQYSRGEMWFTYDFDLTTPMQRKQDALDAAVKAKGRRNSVSAREMDINTEANPTLPLWRRADRRFWHNEHLSKDFVAAGLHSLVLPVMQGYVQIVDLPIDAPSPPARTLDLSGDAMDAASEVTSGERLRAQLLLISRRSKERAGLRYQRRGINSQGQVANYTETEQILFVRRGHSERHILSFVQFRGSIPLYWKQDPFSMKPPPLLEGRPDENTKACTKHFDAQLALHRRVICVNLAEQHGKEGAITKAYEDVVKTLNNVNVVYKPFDFHEECKGMRFERVSKLIDDLKDNELKQMDCFWKSVSTGQNEAVNSRQTAAFRVSCLDCLDRTNVVQSAFARYMLTVQLERLGIHLAANRGEGDALFDFAFNDSWANNGDMISQIYAGTRALKGDFTRTGKRNLMGMMNDATNSVYRMVQGAITDFFKQTVIDFQYGYCSLATLERYNDNLAAPDPSQVNRLSRARADAVDTCAREIVPHDEELLAGWTLFSPIDVNRIESPRLEEKVVLITNKALYPCGYDFTAHKVAEFSKILLGDVVGIKRGVYILSPNEAYHPENHWGMVVSYLNEERRLNTASIRSRPDTELLTPGAVNFIAFRAVVDEATVTALRGARADETIKAAPAFLAQLRRQQSGDALTSHDVVDAIVELLTQQCKAAGAFDADDPAQAGAFVKEETIQSLAQAKANASLFAPLLEGLKRRVWL